LLSSSIYFLKKLLYINREETAILYGVTTPVWRGRE